MLACIVFIQRVGYQTPFKMASYPWGIHHLSQSPGLLIKGTRLLEYPYKSTGQDGMARIWSQLTGSNRGPSDYKSLALPTELSWPWN